MDKYFGGRPCPLPLPSRILHAAKHFRTHYKNTTHFIVNKTSNSLSNRYPYHVTFDQDSSSGREKDDPIDSERSLKMRFATRPALLAAAYLALQSHALPRPAAPSYSVVAVDGGQNSNPAPTTIIQTVTDSIESTPTTVSVTIEETQPAATTTLLSTQQAPTPSPNTVTLQPEISTVSAPTVVAPGSRTSYTTTAIVSQTTTVVDAEQTTIYEQGPTTTVVSIVTPSTSYFDNGMWHTSYGVPVWPTKHVMEKGYNSTTPCSTGAPRQ